MEIIVLKAQSFCLLGQHWHLQIIGVQKYIMYAKVNTRRLMDIHILQSMVGYV